jgi:hypothetical protein
VILIHGDSAPSLDYYIPKIAHPLEAQANLCPALHAVGWGLFGRGLK